VRLVVDGNDGTGKSTLVEALRLRGFAAADRGIPTKMTDDRGIRPPDD
jgi:predicted ATPase